MKSPSKNRGAASVLVIVVVVIVGWTIGMFMQGRPPKKDSDSSPKKGTPAQGEDQKKTSQDSARKP
jgi:hypothetical protein